ncbi:MAG: hypothetical protein PHV37_08725 [Candidatus Gastranaerophilales bacterium]|nr:hypothetical protein [Candidatus Gastranaerophilales bacterium]
MEINSINMNTYNMVARLGMQTQMPNEKCNYCTFNQPLVKSIVDQKEAALPYIGGFLNTVNDERQVSEGLYTLDRMIDTGVQGVDKLYPVISRFNDTNSPNVQVLLAGIYRKTKVPDAFGPLNKMLLKQTFYPNSPYFDPTEEIGGAILEYLKSSAAVNTYSAKL